MPNFTPTCSPKCTVWMAMTARKWTHNAKLIVCEACTSEALASKSNSLPNIALPILHPKDILDV